VSRDLNLPAISHAYNILAATDVIQRSADDRQMLRRRELCQIALNRFDAFLDHRFLLSLASKNAITLKHHGTSVLIASMRPPVACVVDTGSGVADRG
jgi:hypothetical protein